MSRAQPIVPVVLSGGSGTRLWPLSRERLPKQLLPLLGSRTLLQETLLRARAASPLPAILVCNEAHRFLVAEQAREADCEVEAILLEPLARNTAPAIAVAAHEAQHRHGRDVRLLVLPADHVMTDVPAFAKAVERAVDVAAGGRAVTFGIRANRPETGFGYLEAGAAIPGVEDAYAVAAFVEKPDLARAEAFVASGRHTWNSGMFLFPAHQLLDRLAAFEPEMADAAQSAWERAKRDPDFVRIDVEAFARSPSNSVDYAVMERLNDAAMVSLDAGWDDVGSFAALWALGDRDEDGVVRIGDVHVRDSYDCYLRAEHRLVAALGVRDLIIVETADAVLVADRHAVQDVKQIVEELKSEGRTRVLRDPPAGV